ncbi:hypothetical protein M472_01360 [Sphingobacterium paucimobilis HER1398]|uniref:HTH araC/xylS-type domain-containing protein n=2 Tax=Sphingobacterium TaxID=28453 RepID=U2HQ35_9SPHI|nr:hypothetical protein M472_01360 [Sphingobacterium paucimobilis HER1398]
MKTITLPDALNIENGHPVQIFDYHSSREMSRQQIVLNQNTISFLIEGKKEVLFNNSALSIDHSKFIIMRNGHCLMTERLSEVNNYRSLLLFFNNESLARFIRDGGFSKPLQSDNPSVFSFKYDEFILRFVQSLLDIAMLSEDTQHRLLEIKFREIMWYLVELYGPDFLYALVEKNDDVTQRFIRTVESNQLSRLTLKELAFLCNMSTSTFKREFEKHYAESPIKWFQNKRLEHAHYLLQHQQKISSEIYVEVGYENLSSFIHAYKAKYGVTPKQHHK